jgi:hypothetical protein
MKPERIEAAEEFWATLHELTNDFEMVGTERNRAAAASFSIAMDHHAAIVLLMKKKFHSSSFALLRILFEAYFRGLWLKHCASDKEVQWLFDGGVPLTKTMISKIEANQAYSAGVLSNLIEEHWTTMCDYTHTGGLHLMCWQSTLAIEPKFEDGELEDCLNKAELFGAVAGLELVQLGKTGDSGERVLELIKKRWH